MLRQGLLDAVAILEASEFVVPLALSRSPSESHQVGLDPRQDPRPLLGSQLQCG